MHTWGQTLTHHPHVHCLVPGGGVALDSRRWVEAKPNFLLSVHALSKAFRRLFLDGLKAESEKGEFSFFGELARLAEPDAFKARMRALRQSPFVVYAKPPFGGPARVLAYLARYTHRTAIANSRLVAVDDNEVAFVYKDYRRGGRSRIMRLAPHEFIRRFLLHVLPDGLHRIRHYGFLAKGERGEKLAYVRDLLHVASKPQEQVDPEKAPCGDPEADAVLTPSCAAQIAGASCAALKPSRPGPPAPFAATRHDNNAPAAPRMRSSQFSQLGHPSRGASLRPLALKLIFEAVRAPTTPTSWPYSTMVQLYPRNRRAQRLRRTGPRTSRSPYGVRPPARFTHSASSRPRLRSIRLTWGRLGQADFNSAAHL